MVSIFFFFSIFILVIILEIIVSLIAVYHKLVENFSQNLLKFCHLGNYSEIFWWLNFMNPPSFVLLSYILFLHVLKNSPHPPKLRLFLLIFCCNFYLVLSWERIFSPNTWKMPFHYLFDVFGFFQSSISLTVSFTENFGYIFPLSGFGLCILVFRQLIMMCSFDFPYV